MDLEKLRNVRIPLPPLLILFTFFLELYKQDLFSVLMAHTKVSPHVLNFPFY